MKRGPIARPNVYRVKGKTAASWETETACWMRGLADTVIEEAKVLRITLLVDVRTGDYLGLHFESEE
jgi:hypothetical protein